MVGDLGGIIRTQELPAAVYYIWSDRERSHVLVGMDVVAEKVMVRGRPMVRVRWFDTNRDVSMEAVRFFCEGEIWGFERAPEEGGGKYYFQPMTLEVYEQKVKGQLMNGLDFANEEEMIEAFLRSGE